MPVNVQLHCEKIQTKQQLQDHLCVTHSFQELTTVSVVCIHKFSQQYMHLTHGPFLTKQVTAGNKIKGNTKSKAEHYSSSFTRTDSTLGQKKNPAIQQSLSFVLLHNSQLFFHFFFSFWSALLNLIFNLPHEYSLRMVYAAQEHTDEHRHPSPLGSLKEMAG